MNDKATRFRNLHRSGKTFIMPNAWDAGTAIILVDAGFEAIATTSAGIAYGHGHPDSSDAISFERWLEITQEIVEAVSVPVSMDSENLYADSPEQVFDNMRSIAATGVVGASIEDFTGHREQPLYDIELASDRVRAVVEAVSILDYPFTITARAECFLTGHDDPLNESIKRIKRYHEAGADCLYVPGVKDIKTIKTIVDAVDAPVNVVMGLAGAPISLAELEQAGVARVSVGGSLARASMGLVRRAAEEMMNRGSFDFAVGQIPNAELDKLFRTIRG